MTTTTAPAEILEAFRYHPDIPPLIKFTNLDHLRRTYERQPRQTHWFDEATTRFFGSRNRALEAPGILVELQTEAPEGVPRYAITVWVLADDGGADPRRWITPWTVTRLHTRRQAQVFARNAFRSWPTSTIWPADLPTELR